MFGATPKLVERKFRKVADGYIFHPKLRGPGYLVSQDQRDVILRAYRWIMGWRGLVAFIALYSIAQVIWLFAGWSNATLIGFGVISFLAPMLGLHFWTVRMVKSRQPIAPPQTDDELRTDVAVTTPWWALAWGLFAFGVGFAYIAYLMVKFRADWILFGLWAFQIAGLWMIVRLIISKWRASQPDSAG